MPRARVGKDAQMCSFAQRADVCASGRGGWICLSHFFMKIFNFSKFNSRPSFGALTKIFNEKYKNKLTLKTGFEKMPLRKARLILGAKVVKNLLSYCKERLCANLKIL